MRSQSIGIIIISLLTLTLVSCNNKDEFSLGKFRIDIATVKTSGVDSYYLTLDNGAKLWVAASDVRWYKPINDQRVFINYTLLQGGNQDFDYMIKVNDIWNILTKGIIDLNTQNADSIGNDPLKVNKMIMGSDFLNVSFLFNYDYDKRKPHAINLVRNTTTADELQDNDEDIIELEFRHNSYGSTINKWNAEGLVSFNLKELQRDDVDSVKIAVKAKERDENNNIIDKTYNLVYKYNNANKESSLVETPVLVIASDEYY